MAVIISYEDNKIRATIIGDKKDSDQWMYQKEAVKRAGFWWNYNVFAWETDPLVYDLKRMTLNKEVLLRENPGVPEALEAARSTLNELALWRGGAFDWNTLSVPPFKGKHPYEDFQKEDILRASRQNRFLFAWETGLGKSYGLAAIYENLHTTLKKVEGMLIFTSKIGVYNLAAELAIDNQPRPGFAKSIHKDDIIAIPSIGMLDRWIAKYNRKYRFKKYDTYDPSKMIERRRIFDIPGKNIFILSYDVWKAIEHVYGKITNAHLDKLFGTGRKMIAFDEVHLIGNPGSDRTKAILKNLDSFYYRYLFTATLIDKEAQLYAPSLILDKALVKGLKYNQWLACYNDLGNRFSKWAVNKYGWHEAEINELKMNLLKYSVKRKAEDCLEIPEMRDNTIWIDMTDEQMEFYEYVAECITKLALTVTKNKDMQKELKAVADNSSFDAAIMSRFSLMQSAVENPYLLRDNETLKGFKETCMIHEKAAKFNYHADFAKLDVLKDILETEVGEYGKRGIVWYTHPKTLEILSEELRDYNPMIISSEDDDEARMAKCTQFKKDSKYKIIIASVNILTTSVTLSPEATFLVYYENTYNYRNYVQSRGRIHRIGQTEVATAYHIYYRDSTDVFMYNSIERKESINDSLLNDMSTFKGSVLLNKAALAHLFKPKMDAAYLAK